MTNNEKVDIRKIFPKLLYKNVDYLQILTEEFKWQRVIF